MRLLHTQTLEMKESFDSQVPSYVILSHTWGNEETSFSEMESNDETARSKAGYHKITKFCALAKRRGFEYGWVDTCCIDKRNSAELSEAITSIMFIFLGDVWPISEGGIDHKVQIAFMKASRWFTRGWTTQVKDPILDSVIISVPLLTISHNKELLAPKTRKLFAKDWSLIDHWENLLSLVAEITNIDERALKDRDTIPSFCVAQRMCWASKRQTTRNEDMAYSLMGLFHVSMPVIYGEGSHKAFRRLQN
ncbi:hypothetical protein HYFRA_00004094 [Hymenoscyphus fraxineus]|uniref:Heterokaryon incompatibility domain-containing protein n=1 Tax=Hymenoscyphus fraxineus TaxID=746836 RepID=A0A9N9KMN5_9HELO|nr:hypothetical protein HYFRA_00004094 [Hymenoscyphus fraxineus]